MPLRKTDTPQDQGSTPPTQPTKPPTQDDISGAVNRAIAAILGISPSTSSIGVISGHPVQREPTVGQTVTVKGQATPAAGAGTGSIYDQFPPAPLSGNQRLSSTLDLLGLLQRQAEATAAAQATPAQPSIAPLLEKLIPPGAVYNPGFEPGGLADTLSNLISGGHGSTIQDAYRRVNPVPVQSLVGTPEQKVAPAPLDIGAAVQMLNQLTAAQPDATQPATPGPTIQGLLGRAHGGVDSGGTMLHVGESRTAPSDEYVYLPPGSQAVVAPREKGKPATIQNAMVSVAKQVMKGKKLKKAALGGVYTDSGGQPLQAMGGMSFQQLMDLINGWRAVDQNQSILDFSNATGTINPAAYGQTRPEVIRALLQQGTPTLQARSLMATIADRQAQTELDRQRLNQQAGLQSQELALRGSQAAQQNSLDMQDLALKRELGEGQLALGNRQADQQARQLLSERATRQLVGPRITAFREPNIVPAI